MHKLLQPLRRHEAHIKEAQGVHCETRQACPVLGFTGRFSKERLTITDPSVL